jgi:hypothetical protein
LITKYIDRFEPGVVAPVAAGLNVCWVLLVLTLLLGTLVARAEQRALKPEFKTVVTAAGK